MGLQAILVCAHSSGLFIAILIHLFNQFIRNPSIPSPPLTDAYKFFPRRSPHSWLKLGCLAGLVPMSTMLDPAMWSMQTHQHRI